LRLLGLAGVILAIVLWLAVTDDTMFGWLERRLLYFPTYDIAHPLTAFGPGAEEVRFGESGRMHGVFVPAPSSPSGRRPTTVAFFHGNGGNLTHRATILARMRAELGTNVFIFDYQGYGQSPGRPSEKATAADARAAIAFLHGRPDVDPTRIAYYGESLGGAIAADLATEIAPLALVVQSAFTSIPDMTGLHYPGLRPLLPFASVRYDTLSAIRRVRAPLLVVHGDADTLVPVELGRRLFAAANEPKRLLIVPGADHNDVYTRGGSELWRAVRELLAGATPPP
jgi:fermentation-respiration switch protein FrsA (DUF1100 family)